MHRVTHKSVILTIILTGVRNPTGKENKKSNSDTILIFTARNNMRAMLKGDLAFFYHSNCKVPGIVGMMEIVQEHSVDGTSLQIWSHA